MLKLLREFLERQPSIKAREIARHFDTDHKSINQILYKNPDIFQSDDANCWTVRVPKELRIEFPSGKWLTAKSFEKTLQESCDPWAFGVRSVTFVLPKECKPMLEATARLLALCNQLMQEKDKVVLDLRESGGTLTYLERIGFYDYLSGAVSVLPSRPRAGLSQVYRDNNNRVVEFRPIDPRNRDDRVAERLMECFVEFAGSKYNGAATTIFGELYDNVFQHSRTILPGFAGLQAYGYTNHIQTVISDNGVGIVGTLLPILAEKFPTVYQIVQNSELPPGVALLKEVFSKGQITQLGPGHGAGLKSSGDQGKKHLAKMSVRQRDFEFRILTSPEGTTYLHQVGLRRLDGTHICFDFTLTQPE